MKLEEKGYQLAHRRGYYANDADSPASPLTAAASVPANGTASGRAAGPPDKSAMLQAMLHGLPGSTQILYKVRVLPASSASETEAASDNLTGATGFAPAKGPFRRFALDYAASPVDVSFSTTPDGLFHASLDFVALVYQPDGQVVVASSRSIQINATASQYATFAHGGIPFHQEISVPVKGDYSIRTGIHDNQSGRIGAVELSVSSVRNLPPTPSSIAPATPPVPVPSQK